MHACTHAPLLVKIILNIGGFWGACKLYFGKLMRALMDKAMDKALDKAMDKAGELC